MSRGKTPVKFYSWPLWITTLGLALIVFYAILTPVWMGIRVVAWISEHGPFRRAG